MKSLQEKYEDLCEIGVEWKDSKISDDIWQERFCALSLFLKNNGRFPSYRSNDSLEIKLGYWCCNQRMFWSQRRLNKDKQEQLESLPGWFWPIPLNKKWENYFSRLEDFVNTNNKLPSPNSENKEESSIGVWCNNQRHNKSDNLLLKIRQERLESIPGWFWSLDDMWELNIQQLRIFVSENNRLPCSASDDDEGRLGRWCINQRKKSNKLSDACKKQLETIPGWFWEKHSDKVWEPKFQETVDYVSKNYKIPSKRAKDPDENTIGVWCDTQRYLKRKNILSKDRKKRLESIPGWFWDKSSSWELNIQRLKDFVSKNNRLPLLSSNEEEQELHRWCGYIRGRKNTNKLSKVHKTQLESIPGWYWDNFHDKQWELNIQQLRNFVSENNRLPSNSASSDEEEKKLNYWCCNRRSDNHNRKLSKVHKTQLESIPGWYWDNFHDKQWELNIQQLRIFVSENNRLPCSASDDEGRLGRWCCNQREKSNKLSDACKKQLETIPGWFWEKHSDKVWMAKFQETVDYVSKNHKIPNNIHSKDKRERSATHWCRSMRSLKRQGKLSESRKEKLQSIEGWWWERSFLQFYQSNMQKFKDFVSKNNRLPLLSSNEEEKELHRWHMNIIYRRDRISSDYRKQLESIPLWSWDCRSARCDFIWQSNFLKVVGFVNKNRRLPNSTEFLGDWCKNQRIDMRCGELPEKYRKQLETIPGWFWEKFQNKEWDNMFRQLKFFIAENKTHPSRFSDKTEKKLSVWCNLQRCRRRNGRLSKIRQKQLETIPGWFWDVDFEGIWQYHFSWIREHKTINGKFPSAYSKNNTEKHMGEWCNRQKYLRRNNKLSKKYQNQLETISGWFWNGRREQTIKQERRIA